MNQFSKVTYLIQKTQKRKYKMKVCIICQVKNSAEYIPAWLAYHTRLADQIFLIDHDSDKDLRGLSNEKLSVFSSKIKTYTLDTNINALMAHKKIQSKFDWVFILDIDEFLPFENRSQLENFTSKNRFYACVYLFWKNGISQANQQSSNLNST